jgi:hypothetical protein
MANNFSKTEMIFWENVLEGFDPNNIMARDVQKYKPPMQSVERSGLTVRRPYPMIADSSTGLDVSSDYKDIVDLTVPTSLSTSDIKNHAFQLTALDRNDPERLKETARASTQRLSSLIDTDVQNTVARHASIVCTETGNFDNYEKLSKGDTGLMEREVNQSVARHLVLNPRAANSVAGDLASRQTLDGTPLSAYARSTLSPVAGFNTKRANVIENLAGSSASGVTVNGANQHATPVAFDSSGTLASGEINDPRYSVLNVSTSHGLVAGDAFTIAGVNAVGMVSKKDTGQLQSFRVIAVVGDALTITPALIPADGTGVQKPYATVTTTPANGAAITVLNTVSTQPSVFYTEPAVEIFCGQLDVGELGSNVDIMRETTDSGIEIIFARQGSIDDLSAKYRLTVWTKAHVKDGQQCGIYLPNQSASFG